MNPRPRRNAMIPFPEIENRSLRRHRSKRAAKQNFHFIFTFSSRSRKFLASRREVHERGRVPETDRKTRNKNSEISESFEHWRRSGEVENETCARKHKDRMRKVELDRRRNQQGRWFVSRWRNARIEEFAPKSRCEERRLSHRSLCDFESVEDEQILD